MEKGIEKRTETKGVGRRWSEGRRNYMSADGVDIRIAGRVPRLR